MPKLPDQRGFYDDIRPFQRRDVKIAQEAYAPEPSRQRRGQIILGSLFFLFMGAALMLRLWAAKREMREVYRPDSVWKGARSPSQPPAPAKPH